MRRFAFILVFAAVAVSCAKMGYPTGGPKDEVPPQPVAVQPANESRNFDKDRFYIGFDEYVVLKNANENVLVSPPLKNKPEYTVKGKGVLVKINDTLQPNTTSSKRLSPTSLKVMCCRVSNMFSPQVPTWIH